MAVREPYIVHANQVNAVQKVPPVRSHFRQAQFGMEQNIQILIYFSIIFLVGMLLQTMFTPATSPPHVEYGGGGERDCVLQSNLSASYHFLLTETEMLATIHHILTFPCLSTNVSQWTSI